MSPTQLVQHAIINDIEILGLTDHDTVAGWDEAVASVRGSLQLDRKSTRLNSSH